MLAIAGRRLVIFAATPGDAADGARTASLLVLFAVCVVPTGLAVGFLRPMAARIGSPKQTARTTWLKRTTLAAAVFVTPALAEELAFRALPLSLAERETMWPWATASIAAFVLYHPVKAALPGVSAARRATFTDPFFLSLAALLGAVCTAAFVMSGSLWPPVALHGTVVAVWLLALGGHARLYEQPNETTH